VGHARHLTRCDAVVGQRRAVGNPCGRNVMPVVASAGGMGGAPQVAILPCTNPSQSASARTFRGRSPPRYGRAYTRHIVAHGATPRAHG
jgi:hypothetical protein